RQKQFSLQFSLAVVVVGLVSWHTNVHDLSLLILPLVLVADYVWSSSPNVGVASRQRMLFLPILPVLISPFWIWLWLHSSKVNLMAIPMLLWAWAIGVEITRGRSMPNVKIATNAMSEH